VTAAAAFSWTTRATTKRASTMGSSGGSRHWNVGETMQRSAQSLYLRTILLRIGMCIAVGGPFPFAFALELKVRENGRSPLFGAFASVALTAEM